MAWLDSLSELKGELAGVRAERLSQTSVDEAEIQEERDELSRLAESLAVSDLLAEMNATLLDGQGSVEKIVSWEIDEEDDGDQGGDPEEEDADVIALILTWEERGERELAIDLGVTDDGIYVQVNGIEEELGNSKGVVVDSYRNQGHYVVYVGDGMSDFEAAARADLVFAHRVLADECERKEIPFHPFTDFCGVLEAVKELTGGLARNGVGPLTEHGDVEEAR